MKAVAVLWLDIDGTVRHGPDELGRFVAGPRDVTVFPEAVERMVAWRMAGGRVVGVSNQGGVALGHVTREQVAHAMGETNRQCGGLFDEIVWCSHHPGAADPEAARCWCRKPSHGLIVAAAVGMAAQHHGEYYPPHLGLMVGDRPEDQQCARLAGLDFQWAKDWRAATTVPAKTAAYLHGGPHDGRTLHIDKPEQLLRLPVPTPVDIRAVWADEVPALTFRDATYQLRALIGRHAVYDYLGTA